MIFLVIQARKVIFPESQFFPQPIPQVVQAIPFGRIASDLHEIAFIRGVPGRGARASHLGCDCLGLGCDCLGLGCACLGLGCDCLGVGCCVGLGRDCDCVGPDLDGGFATCSIAVADVGYRHLPVCGGSSRRRIPGLTGGIFGHFDHGLDPGGPGTIGAFGFADPVRFFDHHGVSGASWPLNVSETFIAGMRWWEARVPRVGVHFLEEVSNPGGHGT
ncbi:hypothetical protein QBC39DRAFT_360702 [Podospora conica]|nr:hypothetical protein QBC39DRAFT_360702 [Schizothecium conicum]